MSKKQKKKHILVDEETHKSVKLLAVEYGLTLGQIIKKLLEDKRNE